MKKHLIFCATFFLMRAAYSQSIGSLHNVVHRDTLNTITSDSAKALLRNDSTANISLSDTTNNYRRAGFVQTPVSVNSPTNNNVGAKSAIGKNNSPYKTNFKTDGLVITGAVATTLAGYVLIENKKDLTPAELATKTKNKLPFFDRWIAGNYSAQANKDSYILFDADYVIPVAMIFINKNERAMAGQLITLYVETIGITGALYTLSAGLVYRSRPFVYGDKAPLDKRLDKGGQRSFYGGHVATTAATAFLTAKIFADFNPHSKLRPYLWVASGVLTGAMAYMRMRAGYHFLSDCFLSGIIGTATGILVPSFHKNKNFDKISLAPSMVNGSAGMYLTYRF
jgi:membrane-associated phospholipid phosphatase